MFNKLHSYLLGICIITSPIALSLTSDQQLPAKFNSDTVSFNQKTGLTIFLGHVEIEQGTTHLTADKLTIYSDEQHKVYKMVAEGKQAHYKTLPDNQTTILDAYGDTIEYYPVQKKAIIIGNGLIEQEPNQFRGSHIVYDIAAQHIISLPSKGTQSVLLLQPQALTGKI